MPLQVSNSSVAYVQYLAVFKPKDLHCHILQREASPSLPLQVSAHFTHLLAQME